MAREDMTARASWKFVFVSTTLAGVVAGCDGDSSDSGTESAMTTGELGGEASSSTTTTGPTPWDPGPKCPQVSYYFCSQPPSVEWIVLDERGCLPKPCSPDAAQTGCAEDEECVAHAECQGLTVVCFEEGDTCTCDTDPTCVDYGCRVLPQ